MKIEASPTGKRRLPHAETQITGITDRGYQPPTTPWYFKEDKDQRGERRLQGAGSREEGGRERERDRQTDRQTDRDRET